MTLHRLLALTLVLILSLGGAALAAPRNLPEGFVIGDTDGLQVDDHGEYYIHEKGLRPGDTIHKRIVIRNTEDDLPYSLTLTSAPMACTGPINLLERIQMVMTLDGTIIYSGRVYGDAGSNMVENPLDLGFYRYLEEATLDIQLTLDRNIPQEMFTEVSTAEVGWIFRAIKRDASYTPSEPRPVVPGSYDPLSPPGAPEMPGAPIATATPRPAIPFLPQTGDGSPLTVVIALLLASIVAAEWIVYQRYKKGLPRK